jgi:hypothetical protein
LIHAVTRFLPLLTLCAFFAPCLHARAAEPGDELSVYLITMEPGDEIFEKFGHNAILVHDAFSNSNDLFNYGVFDFSASNFYYKFLKGELDYWLEVWPAEAPLDDYAAHNRSIWQQELNLSPAQKVKLRDFLFWNARDANKFYRYNYYNDNCSTRVRDAIDKVLDGQIKAQLEDKPTGTSYRWHTRRLTRVEPVWYTLLNTLLGPATDRPISQWEESFLPLKFRDHIRSLTIKGADGSDVPLVKSEKTLFTGTRTPEPTSPPMWWPWYLLIGVVIGGAILLLARAAPRGKWSRRGFGVVATGYVVLLAFCGWFGLWAWFATTHWSAWRNENLFGYSPFALPLVVTLPMLARKTKTTKNARAVQLAVASAIFVAASTILGVVLSILLPQRIAEPMALVLPINVALAWAVLLYSRQSITDGKPHVTPHPKRTS